MLLFVTRAERGQMRPSYGFGVAQIGVAKGVGVPNRPFWDPFWGLLRGLVTPKDH